MKVQGLNFIRTFPKKNKKKLFNLGCKTMRINVASKDVGARENGAKRHVKKYFFAHPKAILWRRCL